MSGFQHSEIIDLAKTRHRQTKTKLIENAKGKLLTEGRAIHKNWTEYCMELYNNKYVEERGQDRKQRKWRSTNTLRRSGGC